jgi:hypothetical protein
MSIEAEKPKASMNWFLAILTWFLVSGFMSVIVALFLRHVPEGNREILVYMVGQLSGFASAAVAYWMNTTHQSAVKTEMISKADKIS